jgi:hypothetical protein
VGDKLAGKARLVVKCGLAEMFAGPGLTEVRWASLSEASKLMGGAIFEPIRECLKRTLGLSG